MNDWPRQRFVEVADGIVAALNGNGEMGVANAVFAIEENKALVIDTMTFPEMAQEMADQITRRGASVEMVLNTHHHIDHIGGNKCFASAPIVGHPFSIQALHNSTMPIAAFDKLMPRFSGRFANLDLVLPQPNLDQLTPPHKGVPLIFTAAHTVRDIAVWFPESRNPGRRRPQFHWRHSPGTQWPALWLDRCLDCSAGVAATRRYPWTRPSRNRSRSCGLAQLPTIRTRNGSDGRTGRTDTA